MPWDATELRITDQKDAKTDAHQLVCGDGDSSVLQPAWHPSGALFYLTDEQGFYALQRFEGGASKTVLSVADADLGGSAPGWGLRPAGLYFSGRRPRRRGLSGPPRRVRPPSRCSPMAGTAFRPSTRSTPAR